MCWGRGHAQDLSSRHVLFLREFLRGHRPASQTDLLIAKVDLNSRFFYRQYSGGFCSFDEFVQTGDLAI